MYVVRDIFKAKPGHAKQLVGLLKEASVPMLNHGPKNIRVLTDVVASFWSVVWEFEVEEVNDYLEMNKSVDGDVTVYNALEGYKDHIMEGHRENFRIE